MDLGPHNKAFHNALRKYPDAYEALHYLWNETVAKQSSPDIVERLRKENRILRAEVSRFKACLAKIDCLSRG